MYVALLCYRSQEADEIEMGEMFECIKSACEANRSTGCVNCKTIDTFKKHVSPVLESGDV